MDEYELTDKQREAVETLLEHGDVITSSSHSLAITDADVQSIIAGLPDSLPQERKDVVKNAGSLPSLTLPKKGRTENKLKKSRFYADFFELFLLTNTENYDIIYLI